ncbi:MAG: hypothetical protein HY813_01515 [Candidatus Portnoybacteria bacterium]|nr:hypothetical protein [Candidatus Portnoybacteria bacterium]
MDTKNFNTFNIVLIILIVLGSAGAGVAYYGLKETPPALPQEDQIETPDFSSQAQQTPSSAITEIVWPSDQAVVGVESPTASGPAMSFSYPVSQLSGPAGNQVADAYLSAYQEIQKNKDSYKEVNFNATIYQYLPLRDFLAGLDIQINADVYNLLDQADYRAVFCCQDASTTNKGLFLKTKPLNTPEEFTRVTKQMGKAIRQHQGYGRRESLFRVCLLGRDAFYFQ